MLYYDQEVAIHHAKHEEVCICGVVVLAEKSLFYTTFVVCRSLSFTLSPMRQNQYGYQNFYHCRGESQLANNNTIK